MNKPKPVAKVTNNHEHGSGNHFNIVWLQPGAMRAGMELYSEPVQEEMSVPDGCAIINRKLTPEAWKRLCNANIWPVTPKSFQRMLNVLADVAAVTQPPPPPQQSPWQPIATPIENGRRVIVASSNRMALFYGQFREYPYPRVVANDGGYITEFYAWMYEPELPPIPEPAP